METLEKRLEFLRGNKTQKQFAELLNIDKSYIQKYEKGIVKPSTNFYTSLVNKLNVNINWLLTGNGEPYQTNENNQELLKRIRELERLNKSLTKNALNEFTEIIKENINKTYKP